MPTRVRIREEYSVQYPDPLDVAAGTVLQVGQEDKDFPGWKWCKSPDGRAGWVPVDPLSGRGDQASVRQDYSSRELPVRPGEEVIVEDARHAWLLVRNARGERGWIPESHAEPLSLAQDASRSQS